MLDHNCVRKVRDYAREAERVREGGRRRCTGTFVVERKPGMAGEEAALGRLVALPLAVGKWLLGDTLYRLLKVPLLCAEYLCSASSTAAA